MKSAGWNHTKFLKYELYAYVFPTTICLYFSDGSRGLTPLLDLEKKTKIYELRKEILESNETMREKVIN